MIKHDFSELHIFQDKAIEFYAVICLHRYGRGPAIGGCRWMNYASTDDAINEAIRLSRAMSYKAMISELPHDGGKAVMMQSSVLQRDDALNRFAECVHSLTGKYITTIDSGTSTSDLSVIKNKTPFVIGYSEEELDENDPSLSTAFGVYKGIKMAAELQYGDDSLKNRCVAIQGVGNVGYQLAKFLAEEGANIIVSDVKASMAERCAAEFQAKVVAPHDIYSVPCDIFSPCALGQVIHDASISKLTAKIIAGAANDQLISNEMANKLDRAGIFYIPDFLINAGGLIHLSLQMDGKDKKAIRDSVSKIANRILSLYERGQSQKQTLFEATLDKVKQEMPIIFS